MPGADARRRVSVVSRKPCINNLYDSRKHMPTYLPAGLTQYVPNNFTKNARPRIPSSRTTSRHPSNDLKVTRSRGVIIAVMYVTHWTRLCRQSWKREIEPPALSPACSALSDRRSESAPPSHQPPVPPIADRRCTAETFSRRRRAFCGTRLRLRTAR